MSTLLVWLASSMLRASADLRIRLETQLMSNECAQVLSQLNSTILYENMLNALVQLIRLLHILLRKRALENDSTSMSHLRHLSPGTPWSPAKAHCHCGIRTS